MLKQFFEAKAPRENDLTESSKKSSVLNFDDLPVRRLDSHLAKQSVKPNEQVAESIMTPGAPAKEFRESSFSVINSSPRQSKSLTQLKLDEMRTRRLTRESHRKEMKDFFAILDGKEAERKSMTPIALNEP